MYLSKLSLLSFRNISKLTLHLHPRLNLFVGGNGEGKTNVVESIYVLSFGKSFRVSDHRQMLLYGADQASISASLCREAGCEERLLRLNSEKKEYFKDGKQIRSNPFVSFPVILFSPESLLLFKESPQERRDYFDRLLSKSSAAYSHLLSRYKRALSQRNKILKEESLSREVKRKQIQIWEGPLIEDGISLIRARKDWIQRLNPFLTKHYMIISNEARQANVMYVKNVSEEEFLERQEARREEELERGLSLVGPHRDDFWAMLGEKNFSFFGSQGEMRSFILSLKLAEIELLEDLLKNPPLLILDDLLSELDEKRSNHFFDLLQNFKGQIFATATSMSHFPQSLKTDFQAWSMKEGVATPI